MPPKEPTMNTLQSRAVVLVSALVACISAATLSHAGHEAALAARAGQAPVNVVPGRAGDTSVPAASSVFAGRTAAAQEDAPSF
jgi:3-polyprenyl-4-hydroxybenzoate decarboxylase